MPDVAVHMSFGEEVYTALPPSVRARLADAPYRMALLGPDLWFLYRPWIRHNTRGRTMHTTRTGDFLIALAEEARKSSAPDTAFSYLAGFLCHYALDAAAHPYIIRRTTTEFTEPGSHRGFEHSLDVEDLKRQGLWGERHPITAHSLPALSLPAELGPVLDAAYGRVYGWTGCRRSINRCYRAFRFVYRLMENPRGLGVLLTRLTGRPSLRSLIYACSPYANEDVENRAGARWLHSHDETVESTESFAGLRAAALSRAVAMICAADAYLRLPSGGEAELREAFGSLSYLSGLHVEDPRNWSVPSMLPTAPCPTGAPAAPAKPAKTESETGS